jgi:hypothetical protein
MPVFFIARMTFFVSKGLPLCVINQLRASYGPRISHSTHCLLSHPTHLFTIVTVFCAVHNKFGTLVVLVRASLGRPKTQTKLFRRL